MGKAKLNGINVHYQIKGEGPDVVMLHGVTSSLAIWYAKVMPELSNQFRVTAYDLRGHGYSDATPTGYTSRTMADDLLALLDHLHIEKARLVGHSFGGSIALHLALLHPERVEAVVLGDTGVACLRYLRTIQDWPGWEIYKDRIAKYGITYEWFVEAEATDVRNVIRKSYDMKQPYGARKNGLVGTPRLRKLIEETNIAAEFREVAGMTEESLAAVKPPVLAVYGETSPYQKMAARLTEVVPNCRALLIPGTGHFYLLENVDLFIDTIRPFLADPARYNANQPKIAYTQRPSRPDPRLSGPLGGTQTKPSPASRPVNPIAASIAESHVTSNGEKPMSRILLVSPKFDSEFAKARQMAKVDVGEGAVQSLMVPLHLATVAALTPPEFHVDIWDEGAKGEIDDNTDLGHTYDLVGVTGYIAHIPRAVEIAKSIKRRGIPVVIGGPGVSGSPEQCRGIFDVIFLGEAELTWPRFLQEWKHGIHRNEYRQVERPDLTNSPAPRWDSVASSIARYRLAGVQTTRGCPYDCEFCDVIHLFGRQPRHKPVARVIEEIMTLQKLGAQRVFICDDDFIGDKKYAKELLRALIPVNNSFDPPLTYSTQLTIDLARDEELMELMADCNFTQALIGIETPRVASLEETNKIQNLRGNLLEDCRKIQSYGIAVKAALIVGFDNDDTHVFDEQIQFVEDAHIPITTINTMKAYPGTPLWVRLQRDNRVVDVDDIYDESPKVVSNIIPKGMTRVELLEGYLRLIQELRAWPSFSRRMKAFISGITRKNNVAPPSQRVRAERMAKLGKARESLGWLPEDARNAISELIMHTMQHAPHMIEHVGILTMQHAMDHALLPFHGEIIQRQIDKTKSGQLKLAPDPSAGMIPDNFQSALRGVMPTIFDRFAAEMNHPEDMPEAMVALLKDFLIRWGPSFKQFEDYHMVYIHELCDRHVQRFNLALHGQTAVVSGNGNGNGSARVGGNGRPAPVGLKREQVQSAKFLSAVLVAVEQEMRGEVRSKVNVETIPLTIRNAAAATA